MSDKTLKEILNSTRQLIAVKTAEYNTNVKVAKGLEGKGDEVRLSKTLDSTNKTLEADESALEPTKQPLLSSDAKADPSTGGSGTKADLRGKNESNETDRSNTLGSEDAAPVSKKEKDLISGDANAKTAAAVIANEILGAIRESQKQAEAKVAVPEKKASAAKVDIKPTAAPAVEAKKASQGPMLELTTDVLSKIAAMVLSTDEGANFVEDFMAKQAGAEAAKETLEFLAKQAELAEKQAAYEQGQADAEALINKAIYMAGMEAAQKQASAPVSQFAKLGQAMADASMSDLMGQMGGAPGAAGAEGAGAPPADMGAGAPPADAGAGAAGAEGEISPEELQQALEALAQEGTITPEEAQQVMQYISSEGAGAPPADAGAGAPPADAGAGQEAGAPPAEKPAEKSEDKKPEDKKPEDKKSEGEECKEGSVKAATADLLAAIRAARSKK